MTTTFLKKKRKKRNKGGLGSLEDGGVDHSSNHLLMYKVFLML